MFALYEKMTPRLDLSGDAILPTLSRLVCIRPVVPL